MDIKLISFDAIIFIYSKEKMKFYSMFNSWKYFKFLIVIFKICNFSYLFKKNVMVLQIFFQYLLIVLKYLPEVLSAVLQLTDEFECTGLTDKGNWSPQCDAPTIVRHSKLRRSLSRHKRRPNSVVNVNF